MTQTIRLIGPPQRALACQLIGKAPDGYVVKIGEPKRTSEQNDKMWAMLSDVSRAKPDGRRHTPEVWKALFMQSLGHESRFEMGLDDRPFPVGFSTSALNKRQMSDLIECIAEYGARKNVVWSA
jgi:hypothetical protein